MKGDLRERLLRKHVEYEGAFAGEHLINPDGPEAADLIGSLRAALVEIRALAVCGRRGWLDGISQIIQRADAALAKIPKEPSQWPQKQPWK